MCASAVLYLEGRRAGENQVEVSIETYVTIFVLSNCENYNVTLCFVDFENDLHFTIPQSAFSCMNVFYKSKEKFQSSVPYCTLPVVELEDKRTIIGGLCAILRWSIKCLLEINPSEALKSLLGFRGGCLVSCAEVSTWTKLCEIEFPDAVSLVAKSFKNGDTAIDIPECLVKLECHLRSPVKTHNISKRKHDLVKELRNNHGKGLNNLENETVKKLESTSESSSTNDREELRDMNSSENFSLKHCYLEGIDLTLTDVMIVPCVKFLFDYLSPNALNAFEYIQAWYHNVTNLPSVQKASAAVSWSAVTELVEEPLLAINNSDILIEIKECNLFTRVSSGMQGKTKNFNPLPVISLIKANKIVPKYVPNVLPDLNWSKLDPILHPSGGELPQKRIKRKCEQLQNMVSAVLEVAPWKCTIVDFCSGRGHVGLLLAHKRPDCKVILIENKEECIQKARERAFALKLHNVRFIQCNLDYFSSHFDVGVSLHACGLATDLVIKKCISQKAAFVCCPCCYGAIQETPGIIYPRSSTFRNIPITYEDYSVLAHCADRTEINTAKQREGMFCMGLVDTDRLLYANENGYSTELMKMEPSTCSTKHNLLIGRPKFIF